MTHAYNLELEVYQALLDLHKTASDDPQVKNLVSLKPLTQSRLTN